MVLSPEWKGYNVTNSQGHDCGLLGPGNSVVRWPREDATESLRARVWCPCDAPRVGLGPAPRPLPLLSHHDVGLPRGTGLVEVLGDP